MISRLFTCVLALLHFCLSSGLYQPETLPDIGDAEFIEECVRTHNRFRSGVNPPASNMLYMSWDPDLAKTARVQDAITSWYKEVRDYTYTTNSCSRICGHYTQVVWAQSYKVGCAVHFCPTVSYFSGTNAAHFICNYGPAGNYRWHPYGTGAACSKCNGERCTDNLCRNTKRDKVISDSRWHPAWDRPACDEYCISVVVLRLLLLILTIVATWILPKYWSIAPATK
ncbi:glioma pathogenesis-related protein 1 isoform X1 [Gallus gallus]|uniref:glioma pathogenesis-related protein 1 isoform X1 n=1 Tax=Gallus gallus TaxID=9031 RepID=UPI001AE1A9A6|nr:glioma pathogenesis-related protein 1 isoform X1 [Gallus gallus]